MRSSHLPVVMDRQPVSLISILHGDLRPTMSNGPSAPGLGPKKPHGLGHVAITAVGGSDG